MGTFLIFAIIVVLLSAIYKLKAGADKSSDDASFSNIMDKVCKINYLEPTEQIMSAMRCYNNCDFDDPEVLLKTYIENYLVYGDKLILPSLDHLRTLSASDMPENYIEDFIAEFWERLEIEFFNIKNKRFKLIKTNDRVARAFVKELSTRNGLTIDDVDEMSGLEFEHFLCKLFNEDGYNAEVTQASNDQGADLIIEKLGERTVVQAKCYSNAVSNSAIQEVVAAKSHYNCSNAMVVTNSYFTKSAIILAMSNKVILYDRAKLKEKLADYNLSKLNTCDEA